MRHNDHKYIEALLQNNSRLIEDIYKQHSGKIKGMVLKNNGTETDAADLFQEALIDLHRKALKGFELTCPLGALLHLMCRNRWLNELQRRKRHPLTFSEAVGFTINQDDNDPDLQYHVIQKKRALVNEMLEKIGGNNKKLLLLAWSGKPMKEVASQLQISYGYVRKRKTECMAKLITMVRQSQKYDSINSLGT